MQMLDGLLELAFESLESLGSEDADSSYLRFDAAAVCRGMGLREEADPGRRVREYWKKLAKLFPEWRAGLVEQAQAMGCGVIPVVEKLESAGRNPVEYQVGLQRIDESPELPTPETLPRSWVVYRKERTRPVRLWLLGIGVRLGPVAKGMIAACMAATVLVVFVLGMWAAWLGLHGEIQAMMSLSVIMLAIWLFAHAVLGPVFFTASNGVGMARDHLVPMSEVEPVQLVKVVNDDGTTTIDMVKHVADCPICKGRVTVNGGGLAFPFRLVGRCRRSPREHVFSFDHVTRTGMPLRMYLP